MQVSKELIEKLRADFERQEKDRYENDEPPIHDYYCYKFFSDRTGVPIWSFHAMFANATVIELRNWRDKLAEAISGEPNRGNEFKICRRRWDGIYEDIDLNEPGSTNGADNLSY